MLGEPLLGLRAVVHRVDEVTLAAEQRFELPAEPGVVVDDEYPNLHLYRPYELYRFYEAWAGTWITHPVIMPSSPIGSSEPPCAASSRPATAHSTTPSSLLGLAGFSPERRSSSRRAAAAVASSTEASIGRV